MTYPQAYDSYNYMPRLTKATKQERAIKLDKALKNNKESLTKVAKELGITPQAVYARKKKNPEFQSIRQQAIQRAARQAGFTLARIYNVFNEALDANVVSCFNGKAIESDAPDHRARIMSGKVGLELFGHIGGDAIEDKKPTEINVYYGHRKKPPQKEDDGST